MGNFENTRFSREEVVISKKRCHRIIRNTSVSLRTLEFEVNCGHATLHNAAFLTRLFVYFLTGFAES